MAIGDKNPKEPRLNPSEVHNRTTPKSQEKTRFGNQDKGHQPEFRDGRLVKQHGEAGNPIGFKASDAAKKMNPIERKPIKTAVSSPPPIDKNTAPPASEIKDPAFAKKLPPVAQVSVFNKLKALKVQPAGKISGLAYVMFVVFALMATVTLAAGYVGYYLFFIALRLIDITLRIVLVLLRPILIIFAILFGNIFGRLASYSLYFILLFFSGYTFMQVNPELFQSLKDGGGRAVAKIEELTGFRLPDFPDLRYFTSPEETLDSLKSGIENFDFSNLDFSDPESLADAFNMMPLPTELEPISNIKQSPDTLNYFKRLLQNNQLGTGAQGAVPMLKQGLYSTNNQISQSYRRALQNIKSGNADRVLKEFDQYVKGLEGDARGFVRDQNLGY